MKYTIILLCCCFAAVGQNDPEILYLWENGAPGFEHLSEEPEQAKDYWVKNVHHPSLLVFRPEQPNGAAIIVCPGGGHDKLVITSEGYRPAKYLNSLGITVFVLKYRLPREENSPYDLDIHLKEDGQRAMRMVRANASSFGIAPHKIGMMGFSAGGEVVAEVVYSDQPSTADTSDEIEQISASPNFQIVVYPGPLGIPEAFPEELPPAFIIATNDDACCSAPVVAILNGYRQNNASVEMHLFSRGGHAFNMGTRSTLNSLKSWPELLKNWLSIEGFLGD